MSGWPVSGSGFAQAQELEEVLDRSGDEHGRPDGDEVPFVALGE